MKGIAHRHHQRAVGQEDDPRAIVIALNAARRGRENLLAVADPRFTVRIVICKAHQRKRVGAVALLGGIGNIDQAVFGKIGVQRHVEQTGLRAGGGVHPRIWLARGKVMDQRRAPVGGDPLELARPLGHQHRAIGQEGERPGMIEAIRHCFNRVIDRSGIDPAHGFAGLRSGGGSPLVRTGGQRAQCDNGKNSLEVSHIGSLCEDAV